jgi:hypothetical protein
VRLALKLATATWGAGARRHHALHSGERILHQFLYFFEGFKAVVKVKIYEYFGEVTSI